MVRKIAIIIALSSSLVLTTACNTVKGAGKDIESVGNAGDKAM